MRSGLTPTTVLVGASVGTVRDSHARAGDAETGSGLAHGAASSKPSRWCAGGRRAGQQTRRSPPKLASDGVPNEPAIGGVFSLGSAFAPSMSKT